MDGINCNIISNYLNILGYYIKVNQCHFSDAFDTKYNVSNIFCTLHVHSYKWTLVTCSHWLANS